jgi:hypothetical protein
VLLCSRAVGAALRIGSTRILVTQKSPRYQDARPTVRVESRIEDIQARAPVPGHLNIAAFCDNRRSLIALETLWRRGRDLNSRTPCEVSSFQDWHVRPLRHPSKPVNVSLDHSHRRNESTGQESSAKVVQQMADNGWPTL